MSKSMRGINFAEKFKASCLYKELYLNHRDELFLAIRNDYLNIYYNNISIAKVSFTQSGQIRCEINEYYFTGISNSPSVTLCSEKEIAERIITQYETIKRNSEKKTNEEKKSQAQLFIKNNRNRLSEWYCTDVEWCRPRDEEHRDFNARFDIVAISKKAPHRIAIIELKYGREAVSGSSGLMKHITDFYKFGKYGYYEQFKLETWSILKNLRNLDPDYPRELEQVRLDQIAQCPEFYVITLDNNAYGRQCAPKQTVGGYLFNDPSRWNSPRVSSNTIESKFGDVTDPDNDKVYARFLFSPATIDDLRDMHEIDIIEDAIYQLPSRRIECDSPSRIGLAVERKHISNYREKEKCRQLALLQQGSDLFYGAHGGGTFNNRTWDFCIKNEESQKNLYHGIVNECLDYFRNENIVFWGSEGIPNHILSSQVACLNHLFAIRQDKDMVLKLAKMLIGENAIDVEPMKCDRILTYISFEVTSTRDYLNEKYVKRGANCTSVDAAIVAILKGGMKMLIPIEWKYTEGNEYNIDKSGTEGSGKERLRRYSQLIDSSCQLVTIPSGYLHTIYFVEPFYQLMRQTLWAEQVIAHKEQELIKADDFIHVHVIPKENEQLLYRKYKYSERGLEDTWRSQISGKTIIPVVQALADRFGFGKPVVVADAGLLSKDNIEALVKDGYQYILGARPKNESEKVKESILALNLKYGDVAEIRRKDGSRLVVSCSEKRAAKDRHNREKGLARLQKRVRTGKLTKESINNRGYNKYLKLEGEVNVSIDLAKYEADAAWDGIKGYVTNTKLKAGEVIDHYGDLWYIERAFRFSKFDLAVRPIYHRLRNRIEGHICICFTAYTILLELERILKAAKSEITVHRAQELTKTMYAISYVSPKSSLSQRVILGMSDEQQALCNLVKGGA